MKKLSFLVTFLCSTWILLGTTTFAAFPVSPNTWAEINANPTAYSGALALEMDEPLYNAIFSGYAEVGNPKLDTNSDGRISLSEAGSRKGVIQLWRQRITGTLRGIWYFTKITMLQLYENDLEGEIPLEIGNLLNITSIHLGSNNLQGTIPPTIKNLSKCTVFNIEANKISWTIPSELTQMGAESGNPSFMLISNRLLWTLPASFYETKIRTLYLTNNPELITPSEKSPHWTYYGASRTAWVPEYDLNRSSTIAKYSTYSPQDGIWSTYSGYMILNQDIDGDGHADLNIVWTDEENMPRKNLDVNGDWKPEWSIWTIHTNSREQLYEFVFNRGNPIYETNSVGQNLIEFIGRIPRDYKVIWTGLKKEDFKISDTYPYYVEPISRTDAIAIDDTKPSPVILELNKQVNGKMLNRDMNNDGVPDVNIDINADNKPDFNIDYNGDNIAHFNNGLYGADNVLQTTNAKRLNYDSNNDGRPDFNIDLNGDGIVDEKRDANGNGIVDSEENKPAPSPSSSWWGGGGSSLSKDACPTGDFSPSYYDKTCGTTANLADEVAKKVNVLRPLIVRIFLTATDAQKALVHDIITSCSQTNKKEIIKLACQELVEKWDFYRIAL